ncbi:MAG: hypothetical protein NTV38_02525 [Chloroflexi bacterium]|nr:hypothetical protein [Chloroflexota bacterium]
MSTLLVQIIFGWPAILVSLALCIAGLLSKKVPLVVIGALLFVPPAWFLSGYPRVYWLGPLLPIFLLGAAYALHRKNMLLAWLLTLPAIVVSAWLAVIVLTQ